MFEKKKKESSDFKAPKHATFGNDSDEDEEMLEEEAPNAGNILKELDGAIGKSKQREKNATIAAVYSGTKEKQKTSTKNVNACGCFGG